MSTDLIGKLGELTGALRTVVPALEALEKRENETRDIVTTASANIANLKGILEACKADCVTRVAALQDSETSCRKAELLEKDVASLKQDVKLLTKHAEDAAKELARLRDDTWKKFWDVAKIIISALVGALCYMLAKYFGAG
jgi:chromosome segregation ATPase